MSIIPVPSFQADCIAAHAPQNADVFVCEVRPIDEFSSGVDETHPELANSQPTKPMCESYEPDRNSPESFFDDFVEDLNDPTCVQRIYEFSASQIRGMVDYNDEDDVIQEVFYRLVKWPIGEKYNSAAHYFSLLKITIRQALVAYWKRRHSQRNDARRRVFISQLENDSERIYEFEASSEGVLYRLHINEFVKRVLNRVTSLDESYRTMFKMRFVDERSHEEISQALNISIRTSYRLETKVRELLQTQFKDQISFD